MKHHTLLICPDTHFSYPGAKEGGIDEKALSCFLQAIPIIKPDCFVHIGDVGEWETVSHWRWKRRSRPPIEYVLPELEREIVAINEGMDRIDAELDKVACKTRHLITGNHENWLTDFTTEFPYLEKDYNLTTSLRLKQRGWGLLPYGEYLKVGDLNFIHGGHYTGVNHTRATVIGTGANVAYGHTHDQQVAKVQRLGGLYGAWSVACLCKLQKPFLRGKPSNWSHGFAVVHFEKNGNFHFEQVEIYDGVCWVYGQRVEAK